MSPEVLRSEIRARLNDGTCYEKFKQLIKAQGGELSPSGNPVYVDKPFDSMHVNSPESGYVQRMRADLIGQASVLLGAGRLAKTDKIDYGAGIGFFVKTGDRVERGDSLCAFDYSCDLQEQFFFVFLYAVYQSVFLIVSNYALEKVAV